MNIENLQRMADYIKTIPQHDFTMRVYRYGNEETHECNSMGCVIGHCTILDKNSLPLDIDGHIEYSTWSKSFTGIETHSNEWNWCFSNSWFRSDNTPEGASKRIEWLLNNGLPENWEAQMFQDAKLCYNE